MPPLVLSPPIPDRLRLYTPERYRTFAIIRNGNHEQDVIGSAWNPFRLNKDATISESQTWLRGAGNSINATGTSHRIAAHPYGTGYWQAGDSGYLGFRFNPSGSQPLYGWMHISVNNPINTLTVDGWAYQDDGTAILAGDVPEPASTGAVMGLAALAAGAALLKPRTPEMVSRRLSQT